MLCVVAVCVQRKFADDCATLVKNLHTQLTCHGISNQGGLPALLKLQVLGVVAETYMLSDMSGKEEMQVVFAIIAVLCDGECWGLFSTAGKPVFANSTHMLFRKFLQASADDVDELELTCCDFRDAENSHSYRVRVVGDHFSCKLPTKVLLKRLRKPKPTTSGAFDCKLEKSDLNSVRAEALIELHDSDESGDVRECATDDEQ